MSKSAFVALAGMLLLAGCATPSPLPAPATPVEAAIATHALPNPAPSEVVVQKTLPAYICPDGQRVELDHDVPAGVMRVDRGGETLVLQELVSKTGQQSFASGEYTLELFDGEIRTRRGSSLRQICPQVPAQPTTGQIWGTLIKLDRMALVPGTRARVLLVDAARADAPHIEIASTSITTAGNQVPLHWLIRYDPARVVPRDMTYRLQARIESPQGQLTYITDTAIFVLESEAPQPPMELQLVAVGRSEG